ncbi:MAG: hypothetical protein VKI82_03135 [Leptolyngbya sp.]|nr:hypothetical protein [Leptolyngbya sp.]
MKPRTQTIPLQPRLLSVLLVIGMVLNTACSLTDVSRFSTSPSNGDRLTIDQISRGDEPGQFRLAGTVDLPAEVTLTVSAVRRLNAVNEAMPEGEMTEEAPPSFSTLDRRTATVENGRWQATLGLWQENAEGGYQELWQTPEMALDQATQPDPRVEFFVAVEPKVFAQFLQPAPPKPMEPAIERLLHVTPAGESYLRVSVTQPLGIPEVMTQTSRRRVAQDTASLWAGRSTLDDPDAAEIPLLPFSSEDNLPLPPERLLR